MSAVGFLGDLLAGFAKSFEPLEESLAAGESFSAFLAEFGWAMDPSADINVVQTAIGKLPRDLASIPEVITALENADTGGDLSALGKALSDLETLIKDVADTVHGLSSLTPDNAWPAPLNSAAFWETFAPDLLAHLLYEHVQSQAPRLFAGLQLIGVLSEDYMVPATPGRIAYTRRGVRWDRLIDTVRQPEALLTDVYGWGAKFEVRRLLESIRGLAIAFGLTAGYTGSTPALIAAYYDQSAPGRDSVMELTIPVYYADIDDDGATVGMTSVQLAALPIPPAGIKTVAPVGLALFPRVTGTTDTTFELGAGITAKLTGGFQSEGLVRLELRPSGADVIVDTDTLGSSQLDAAATIDGQPAQPWVLLGRAPGTRVELAHAHVAMRAQGTAADPEFIAEVAVDTGALVLDFGEGDGFLSSVLHGAPQRVAFGLDLSWSSKHGLRLAGQGGLETTIAIHQTLAGVISLDSLYVAFKAQGDGTGASLIAAATGGITLGPFAVSIQRVGLRLDLHPVPAGQPAGNLGAAQLGFGFKAPDGLGLSIDTPAVRGGGFVAFDADAGRYTGVFELTLIDVVSIKAIAIVTTKNADGSPGFALLILITADGFEPIPLGFGFELTGIGGLLALNRTVDADAVRDGLRDGVVDSVLFPKDPVKNATRIIASLDRIFPLAHDRLVIGPLAEISWGTPPIVKIRLALLLEVPKPIRAVILATLGALLPDEQHAVVQVHVDAIGVLDLGRGELALDASLHDSKILQWTLSGDMALRLNWGDAPTFLLSVGGFHPKYTPPAGLRPLNRLSLSLASGQPSVRLECYLAVTSNTVQFGARLTLSAAIAGFGVSGGGSFDALIQWSPFALDVSLQVWVKVTAGGVTLLAASISAEVSGPQPWHVTGVAQVAVLSFSASVPIDFTTGTSAAPLPVDAVDVAALIWEQVGSASAWQAALPAGQSAGVTTATPSASDSPLLVHPLATVTLRQRVAPLDTPIARMGARVPTAGTRSYHLEIISAAGVQTAAVTDLFARAQYQTLSDDERLSRPGFEALPAGVTLTPATATQILAHGAVATDISFHTLDVQSLDEPATPAGVTAADSSALALSHTDRDRPQGPVGQVVAA